MTHACVDRLERRLLMMAYDVSEYFPPDAGRELQYSGRYWHYDSDESFDRTAIMTSSVRSGSINGIPAVAVEDRIRPAGWSTDDEVSTSWYAIDAQGLWGHGGFIDEQKFFYSQLMLPAIVQDGQVVDLIPAAVVSENAMGYSGTIGGRIVIDGTEQVQTLNGWQVSALKVTYTRTLDGVIPESSDSPQTNVAERATYTAWFGRGIGVIKSELVLRQTYTSRGYEPEIRDDGESWTLSGPALPPWATLHDGALRVSGLPAPDFISFAAEGNQVRVTRNGDSVLVSGVTKIRVAAGAGSDAITLQGLAIPSEILGDSGDDTIIGGELGDIIYGGDGNDVIRAGGGVDTVYGNFGSDDIDGLAGADWLLGGLGNDTIKGGAGPDSIAGGDGTDQLRGGLGADHIEGRGKSDSIYGGERNDTIFGGAGADYVDGGEGDDWVNVDAHALFHDTVYGGVGVDTVRADGDDLLYDVETKILS